MSKDNPFSTLRNFLGLRKSQQTELENAQAKAERDEKSGRGKVSDNPPKRRLVGQSAKKGEDTSSYLVDETKSMERQRRLQEQQGHRHLARVHAREHREEDILAPEGELQNSIMSHPLLDSQRFDGVDPNLNPEPPLNSEARREFDNERREQEMEKQLRLGNMPKFSSAPKPQGP